MIRALTAFRSPGLRSLRAQSTSVSRPRPARSAIGLALSMVAAPAFAQDVAITGGTVVIGDGSAPIPGGTVVVRGGRVVSAGSGGAPAGIPTIDATGKWVTPGIVAGFTRLGLVDVDGVSTVNDASGSQTPYSAAIDVAPAINPLATPVAINRAAGVTRALVAPAAEATIFGGQGAVIDTGTDMDAITRARAFQFVEFGETGRSEGGGSRPAVFLQFRASLDAAERYRRSPAAYDGDSKDSILPRADAAALMPVVTGEQRLLVHVERASDILAVLALGRDFPRLKLVLVGASEGWTVAAQIAAAGVPVIASALNDLPASFEMLAATQSNIGRLRAAGVAVAIGMIDDDDPRMAIRSTQYAGNLVALGKLPRAAGLDWNQAFAAISSVPAEAIGMGAEIGSLRPGRRGDVVLWDGDPLELATAVTGVWIDGVQQPLSNRQTRLRDRYRTPGENGRPKAYEH